MDRLKGKVAILTGATGGIGKAIATLFAAESAKVVLTARRSPAGEKLAEGIREQGGEAIFVKHDVTSERDWQEVTEQTLKKFGRLDILVNNAGIMLSKKIEETTLKEWREVITVNLDGVFLGTKYAIGAMRKTSGGSIVNMSSVLGLVGYFDLTATYSASKGGIRAFTKAAAVECSKGGLDYNIRVNSVHPGVVVTPMAEPVLTNEDLKKEMEGGHPMGRLADPMEIAYGVLYLASDESSFVTGIELVIDGGWTAR
jgi:NAD(P)-dependent dehydrogenase (short-subunit alcohol dehydrogenase family)